MKSAWTNLLTGIADENADVDSLVNNLVESTSIAAQNIMPRVEQILSGIGELIAKLAPTIANEIPTLPPIPSWPNVSWSYEDGKYSLNEEDVDKVLNYLENEMPLYEFEINRFEEEISIIINGLLEI